MKPTRKNKKCDKAELCNAAESNEKSFCKLIKSQRSSSQMNPFLVNGELLTEKNKIRNMWADHFEALGSPSEIETFDKDFFIKVSDSVRESLFCFLTDPCGAMSEPLEYKEIVCVCPTLKRLTMSTPVCWAALSETSVSAVSNL